MPRQEVLFKDITYTTLGNKNKVHSAGPLFISALNPGLSLFTLLASSTEQAYFQRRCGKHVLYQTVKHLVANLRDRQTALDCKICDHDQPHLCRIQPSSVERVAHVIVADLFKPHEFVLDAMLFRPDGNVKFSQVDIWIIVLDLLIMVDGEQHFKDSLFTEGNSGTGARTGAEKDSQFNTVAVAKGYTVLRLHYNDVADYQEQISQVVEQCIDKTKTQCVIFTKSYGVE